MILSNSRRKAMKVKNTFDDVQYLAHVGLIELKKTKEGREKATLIVQYDKILLEIFA